MLVYDSGVNKAEPQLMNLKNDVQVEPVIKDYEAELLLKILRKNN